MNGVSIDAYDAIFLMSLMNFFISVLYLVIV